MEKVADHKSYGISFWKLNDNRYPIQLFEYGFNGTPINK